MAEWIYSVFSYDVVPGSETPDSPYFSSLATFETEEEAEESKAYWINEFKKGPAPNPNIRVIVLKVWPLKKAERE
jgi:hypothetical protein